MSKEPKAVRCIINNPDAGPHDNLAPLNVNGTLYPISFNTPLTLPREAFVALENSSFDVARLPASTDETASPAGNGGGDGGASSHGGDSGAAASPHPLDRDNDGKPGGSLPIEPPTLKGKNKAALLAIAETEGVTIPADAKNADIVAAIEAARAA